MAHFSNPKSIILQKAIVREGCLKLLCDILFPILFQKILFESMITQTNARVCKIFQFGINSASERKVGLYHLAAL
jgi:hypothetical protein